MKQPLISVIIPIYNVERFLQQCLESVIAQTYASLEILLINDGSNDGSVIIAQHFAQQDARIRLVHQGNKGLSAARNTGIDHAQGDYIAFVDSDDWLEHDYFEKLMTNALATQADISSVSYYRFNDQSKEFIWYTLRDNSVIEFFTPEEAMNAYYDIIYNRTTSFVVAWGKIYRRYLFDDIRFPVGKYCEDDFTTYKLILASNGIVMDTTPLYCYREREASLSGETFSVQRLNDYREAHEERVAVLATHGLELKPHLIVYRNKLVFVRDRLLEIGAIHQYERAARDTENIEAQLLKRGISW